MLMDNETRYFYKKLRSLKKEIAFNHEILEKLLVEKEKSMKENESLKRENENFKNAIKKNKDTLDQFSKDNEKFQERSQKELKNALKRESKKFLIGFIEVLGHFEYAMANIKDENTLKGIEMVYNEFIKKLENEGVQVINETGVDFDPNVHNAIGVREKKGSHDKVLEIALRGFILDGIVIRAADCYVSKSK